MATKSYSAIDPAPLTRVVLIALYALVGVSALQVVASLWALRLTYGLSEMPDPEVGLPSDLATGLIALVYLTAMIVSGFLSLKWIYRTNRNAHSFARGLSVSPPWSIGWFFVPIALLWKPYEGVKETWQASLSPSGWRTANRPEYMPWWWGLFLLGNFIGNGSARLLFPDTVGELQLSTALDVVTSLLDIPINLLFARLVKDLSELQTTRITYGMFEDEPSRPGPTTSGPATFGGGVVDAQG
jgi:hypothetical protein